MKVEDSTLVVVRALERMNVRHYVCGSLASSLYGDPRATNDADLVVELSAGQSARLARELAKRFYVDEEGVEAAVRNERSFNLIDEVELAKVDVFCVRGVGYQAEALARVRKLEPEPDDPFTLVAVASAEDTIIAKLKWFRQGGETSERQWKDLQGVCAAQQGRLDLDYVRRWCAHFTVTDLLDGLLTPP